MFRILYEDNHLLVTGKEAGILSQADKKNSRNLYAMLQDYLKEKKHKDRVYLAIVHRLDRNTGGVMVFAKTSKAASRLSQQFREHRVVKKYIAITANIPLTGEKGTMKNYLRKDGKLRIALPSKPEEAGSRYAELIYELIETIRFRDRNYYKFLVTPRTGRFHQIRFQFAFHKAPLLGDRKYGKDTSVPFPALWALEIKLLHPTLKKEMAFSYPPPEGWPFSYRPF